MTKQTNQLNKNYNLGHLLFFWGMGVLLTATSVDTFGIIKPFIIAGSVAVVGSLLLTLTNYVKDRKNK